MIWIQLKIFCGNRQLKGLIQVARGYLKYDFKCNLGTFKQLDKYLNFVSNHTSGIWLRQFTANHLVYNQDSTLYVTFKISRRVTSFNIAYGKYFAPMLLGPSQDFLSRQVILLWQESLRFEKANFKENIAFWKKHTQTSSSDINGNDTVNIDNMNEMQYESFNENNHHNSSINNNNNNNYSNSNRYMNEQNQGHNSSKYDSDDVELGMNVMDRDNRARGAFGEEESKDEPWTKLTVKRQDVHENFDKIIHGDSHNKNDNNNVNNMTVNLNGILNNEEFYDGARRCLCTLKQAKIHIVCFRIFLSIWLSVTVETCLQKSQHIEICKCESES